MRELLLRIFNASKPFFNAELPDDLRSFLEHSDGVEGAHGLGLVWSGARILTDNETFRTNRVEPRERQSNLGRPEPLHLLGVVVVGEAEHLSTARICARCAVWPTEKRRAIGGSAANLNSQTSSGRMHEIRSAVFRLVATTDSSVEPPLYDASMKKGQQELPLPMWGGARKGAGRKRKASRPQVPHEARGKFRNGALHVTLRMRGEVWNLRTHRCFRGLRQAFQHGCDRFGVRVIHFSVQGNHIHAIVEAADPQSLARAMKGLEVRMARALNKVMHRRGPVFADRYHSHLLRTPREAAHAVRYVLENQVVHARREGWPIPRGVDPYCSAAPQDRGPPLVVEPLWWMLRVGMNRAPAVRRAA